MRLRWCGALVLLTAAVVVRAQMPSTTRVAAVGGEIVITALGHASVQVEHSADEQKIPNPVVMANRQMRTNEQALAGITVISVPAYNVQRGPAPGQFYHPRDRGQGYILAFADTLAAVRQGRAAQVYVAGDTECVPAIAQWVKGVDVALLPMNLPYTMTPAEAADCARGFRPKIAIPYHHMGQQPEEFAAALKGTPIEVRLIDWYPKAR